MTSIFTNNLINNIDLIVWLYTKPPNNETKIQSFAPVPMILSLAPTDPLVYDANRVILIKDRLGLYFNAMLFKTFDQYQLFNLLYDPENDIPFWITSDDQQGLNQNIYSDDKLSTKIYVPPEVLKLTQIISDGTQEMRNQQSSDLVKMPVINQIKQFPFNSNLTLYNFYFEPETLIADPSLFNLLPPLIQSIYQSLYQQTQVVDLKTIYPKIESYNINSSDLLINHINTKNINTNINTNTNVTDLYLSSVTTDDIYLQTINTQSLKSYQWTNNSCWLDNLFFAMFAPYPYFNIFEKYILNLNLNYTQIHPEFYLNSTEPKYPSKYPQNICHTNIKENWSLLRQMQEALRTDIMNLRTNQFQTCSHLRQIFNQCHKLVKKNYMDASFRDPVINVYLPLLELFGLLNLVKIKKTICQYHNDHNDYKTNITESYDLLPYISLDITDPNWPIPEQGAHLLHVFDHYKLTLINQPPSESLIKLIQKTIHYTIDPCSLLPIMIQRPYREYDKITGQLLSENIKFTPIDIPEILVLDGQSYKLRSMVIRLPNQAHFNSFVNINNQWVYYHNIPNLTDNSKNVEFFDSYQSLIDQYGDQIKSGCYLIFYEHLPLSVNVPIVDYEFDSKCLLIPELPSTHVNTNLITSFYYNYQNSSATDLTIQVLGDHYIMPFVYPGEFVPVNLDEQELNEFVLKKKLLTTMTPKSSDILPLTSFAVGQLIHNQDPETIITQLQTSYDYHPNNWTSELNQTTIEIGRKLLNQGTTYFNVNEFVKEQYYLTVLKPKTIQTPPIHSKDIHPLVHKELSIDHLLIQYDININLWNAELIKSATLVGRLLKLLSNPSLAQILSKYANHNLIGHNLDSSTENYWMEIIKDHTTITTYEKQINQLQTQTQTQTPTETKPKLKIKLKESLTTSQPIIPPILPLPVITQTKLPIKLKIKSEDIKIKSEDIKIKSEDIKIKSEDIKVNAKAKSKIILPISTNNESLTCQTSIECEQLWTKYQSERQPILILPDGDKKTMGANLLYDLKSQSYLVDPTGWWFSEKYDGVRAIWTGQQLLTRNGHVIKAPPAFINQLPKNISLDGELYLGRKMFNQMQGIAVKSEPDIKLWNQLKYLIYDLPDSHDIFENRIKLLNFKLTDIPQVEVVKHHKITNLTDFLNRHQELVKANAEGSMLRRPQSVYTYGHSNNLLKFKSQLDDKGQLIHVLDDDAVILGYNVSTAKTTQGCLGSFNVEWVDKQKFPKNPKYSVGLGLKKWEKCTDYQTTFPIGTVIVVNYTELIEKTQAPRFPRFKEVRAD